MASGPIPPLRSQRSQESLASTGTFRTWCQHWCILELSWWPFLVAALVRSSIFSIQGVGPSDFIETHPSSSIPEKSGKPGLHRWLQDPSLLLSQRSQESLASTGGFRTWCQHWCILELSWWQHWCILAYSDTFYHAVYSLHRWLQDLVQALVHSGTFLVAALVRSSMFWHILHPGGDIQLFYRDPSLLYGCKMFYGNYIYI